MATPRSKQLVLWFNQLGIKDVPLVGGKNASLGELISQLSAAGVRVPPGFATSETRDFMRATPSPTLEACWV